MTLTINSIFVLIKNTLFVLLALYAWFKVFHYYYPHNYCKSLSGNVIENSPEDITAMRRCVSTVVCEVWDVTRTELEKSQEKGRIVNKSFICVRKVKPGIWKN